MYRTPADRPKARLPVLDALTVPTRCKAAWSAMDGDARTRFCTRCSKSVHDLSAMTEDEAESFLAINLDDDDLGVRLYRRPDGRVLTSDCPSGAKHRHRKRVALAAMLTALGLTAMAFALGDLDVPQTQHPARTFSRFEVPRRRAPPPLPRDQLPPIGGYPHIPTPEEIREAQHFSLQTR